ncbi:MAG: ABC transporter ATP-binding protein [bacterium]
MKSEKRNPLSYLFSKIWEFSQGNRKNVVLYWILFIFANVINTVFHPIVMAKIMDVLQKDGITKNNISLLYFLLGLTLVNDLVFWAFHGPARVIERVNAFKARMNYKKFLLSGVMNLPLPWHIDHHTGDTIDKAEKGTTALYSFSKESFEVISSFVQLIVSFCMLAYFGVEAITIVVVMMAIAIWIIIRFDQVLIPQYVSLNKSENQISQGIIDSISNIGTIIVLRVEKYVFEALSRKMEKPLGLFCKNAKVNEGKWFLTNLCCTIMSILVMALYFWKKIGTNPAVLVASTFLLFRYLEKISELFFRFVGRYSDIVIYKTRIANSEELSNDFVTGSFANHVLPKDWKKLEIKKLNFSYHIEGDSDLHLEDVSLSVLRGEKIVFVGETGSGKTTMLKVMRDLYQPKSVELSVDGQIISDGFAGIARAIALVPQKPEIFATTILENITVGVDYEMGFVRHFTDMTHFTEVALNLPNGFDSSVKEDGLDLSGGQQQRLALSRGLLACYDKEIVLLDEPTSSLDAITEITVYQNILREFKEKTVISTTHGLHLLPFFDRICFFSKGRILATGTLDELLTSCPEFVNLWSATQKASTEIV